MEDFFYDKMEWKKENRTNNLESLGQAMVDAGNEFGPGTAYGTLSTGFLRKMNDLPTVPWSRYQIVLRIKNKLKYPRTIQHTTNSFSVKRMLSFGN